MKEFISEQEITAKSKGTIIPYLTARRSEPHFTARDGKALYVAHYQADEPRGTVVLVHGFSENADKYHEFIYYLLREQLSVLILDQRGHGRSYRAAPQGVIHIDRFGEYINDLEAVLTSFESRLTAPLYLFAHSMGGAIAMLYLEKHPNVFEKAVLSAPMIDLQYRGFSRFISISACRFCTLTGRAKKAVFISKKDYENEPFEHSSSLSPARFGFLREQRRRDPVFSGSAPSYAWSLAALGVAKKILAKGAPERVTLPVLILSAEIEHLVNNEAQQKLAARLPQGTLKQIAGSKHEILFANDEILHPVLGDILNFYSN